MAEEADQAAAALITQQDAERVSAARMRQLFQGDFYEEMKVHLESCLGRSYYAAVDQDMFPEQSTTFVYPLIRACDGVPKIIIIGRHHATRYIRLFGMTRLASSWDRMRI